MEVRMFTVGPVQENCYLFRRDGSDRALIVDPGDEPDRLLRAIDELGVTLDGILLTHTHFDHVGAVAPVAKATGAEVWVPEIEKPVLADIMSFVPWPGFGPYESWDAEHTLAGGERLELAGFEIDVIFTPGHSPGHVTYSIADDEAVFSGDVLFQGSVGRTDLPGGDWPTLLESIRSLIDSLPEQGRARLRLLRICEEVFARAGYGPFESPVFEHTQLFERGVGESTDVVEKEMFTFDDQGGRSLTLRPEGTASVCRAYVEHGMHKAAQPVKVWYWGPFFRYEAPQAGRFRQFTQVGVEALGSDDPSLDAESILLLADLLERAGARGVRLRISSLGTPETRRAYSDEL